MGNEAWEKAVEAGARAGSPAAFDAKNFVGIPHRREVAERFARESAERALRAAFPILAEELLLHAEAAWVEHGGSRIILTTLRARIEQMKEMKE